jgi:hypothetical protein
LSKELVVDANVMALFTRSRVREEDSPARMLVERGREPGSFAIDSAGKMENQWLTTCGNKPGSAFYEWFYQRLKEGVIRPLSADMPKEDKKHLRVERGFPNDRFELTYVAVAYVSRCRYIVTEDIHFFDPALKAAGEETKSKAKNNRTGCVCKYLRKLNVTVGTVAQALAET